MKKAVFAMLLVLLGAIFLVAFKHKPNQGPRLGYIRSGELMAKASIAVAARADIETSQKEAREQIKTLETQLAKAHDVFMQEQANLDATSREKRLLSLQEQEAELYRFREAKRKSLTKLEQEKMAPVLSIINSRVADFAKKEGLAMIWGTLAQGNILYGENEWDVTDAAVAFVNETP